MRYTIAIHHHRFAAWAAARAVQRKLAANSRAVVDALNGCGVVAAAEAPDKQPATAEAFDPLHGEWRKALLTKLPNATHGQAAKVIAIYLKSRVVLSGHHDSPFAKVIHPPIDSMLLKAVAKHVRPRDSAFASWLRTITWTSLDKDKYKRLIDGFRRLDLDKPAFWCLERFWNPWEDEPPLAECE